jgi:hypothetical protein
MERMRFNLLDAMDVLKKCEAKSRQDYEMGGRSIYWWTRPVCWQGSGTALALDMDGQTLLMVPSAKGGDRAYMPSYNSLVGEWEVVDSEVVLNERGGA